MEIFCWSFDRYGGVSEVYPQVIALGFPGEGLDEGDGLVIAAIQLSGEFSGFEVVVLEFLEEGH